MKTHLPIIATLTALALQAGSPLNGTPLDVNIPQTTLSARNDDVSLLSTEEEDYSSYLVNPTCTGADYTGWIRCNKNRSYNHKVNNKDLASDVYNGIGIEYWSWESAQNSYVIMQTATNLPVGHYRIQAFATGRNQNNGNITDGSLNLAANGNMTAITSNTWQNVEVEAEVGLDGVLKTGIYAGQDNKNNWIALSQVKVFYQYSSASCEKAISATESLINKYELNDESLNAALNKAKALLATGGDATQYKQVLSELNTELKTVMQRHMDKVTEDKPLEVTSWFIKNPEFVNNNLDGWTNNMSPGFKCGAFELWRASFDMSQDITGLPSGKYRVVLQARRQRYEGEENMSLYATSSSKDLSTLVLHDTQTEDNGSFHLEQNAFYMNNDPNTSLTTLDLPVMDGKLKIGARCPGTNMWCVINGFHLYYLGELNLSEMWDEMQKEAENLVASPLPTSVAKELNEAMSAEVSEDDQVAWSKALDRLTNAVNVAKEVSNEYSQYLELKSSVETILENSVTEDESSKTKLAESLSTSQNNVENAADATTIRNAVNALESQRQIYIAQAEPINNISFDLSFRINNPTFDEGNINSWNVDNYAGESNYPRFGSGCAEFWHCSFDLNQTITGLKDGLYQLSAQIGSSNNDNVYLYANEVSKTSLSNTTEGMSLGSFGERFQSNRELNRVTVPVTVIDGTLKVGLRTEALDNWIIFDDFKLVYFGEIVNEYANTLDLRVKEAEELFDTYIPDGISGQLQDAITNAQSLTGESTTAQYKDAINDIENAISQAKMAIQYYEEFHAIETACQSYLDVTEADDNRTAFETAVNEAKTVFQTTTNADDIKDQTAALYAARDQFVLSAPTLKEGMSLDVTYKIRNASCAASDGWYPGKSGNNFGCKDYDATVVGEYGKVFLEKWDNAVNYRDNEFFIYQDVTGLPNGIYKLTGAAFRKNQYGDIADYSVALAFNEGEATVKSDVMNYLSVFGVITENNASNARIGLKALLDNNANWVGLADLNLQYLGNDIESYKQYLQELSDELKADIETLSTTETYIEEASAILANNAPAETDDIATLLNKAQAISDEMVKLHEGIQPYQNAMAALEETQNLKLYSEGGTREAFESEIETVISDINGTSEKAVLENVPDRLKNIRQNYMLSGAKPLYGTYFDLTFAINGMFANSTDQWQTEIPTEEDGNFGLVNNNASVNTNDYSGLFCERYFNSWFIENTKGTKALYQAMTGMPVGMYSVKAATFGRREHTGDNVAPNEGSLYLFANNAKSEINSNTFKYVTTSNAMCTDGELEFGILCGENNNLNWMGLADVHLYYYGDIYTVLDENSNINLNSDTYADVTLKNNYEMDKWHTICLPFDVTPTLASSYFKDIRQISAIEEENEYCVVTLGEKLNEIKAGVPYMIQVNTEDDMQFDDVIMHAAEPEATEINGNSLSATFCGYYRPTTLSENTYQTDEDILVPATDNNSKSYQAYLTINSEKAYDMICLQVNGITTQIHNIAGYNELVDVYSINGVLLKKSVKRQDALNGLGKGIYIVNGQKVNNNK